MDTKRKASKPVIPDLPVEKMTSREFQLDTYAHIDVCGQLLKDRVRIKQFQNAIYYNKHLFKDKIVLDVGCGIGILSLFAARAGARRVFAVDCSNVVCYTREIIKANNYGHIITVIKGRIEEVTLPVNTVDIIVSDWMGYSLLFQSLIDGVIFARNKWLNGKNGIIFPDIAKLYVSAFEDNDRKNNKINWWQDVYGYNMKCLREFALTEPSFYAVPPHSIITSEHKIKELNLNTAETSDLTFFSTFLLESKRSGIMDGILTYFSIHFSVSHTPMKFSTDPWSPFTHWMQSVFFFDKHITVPQGENYFGALKMKPIDENLNHIDLCVEIWTGDPGTQLEIQVGQRFKLKKHDEIN